jgi:hypothetical protein
MRYANGDGRPRLHQAKPLYVALPWGLTDRTQDIDRAYLPQNQ